MFELSKCHRLCTFCIEFVQPHFQLLSSSGYIHHS